MKSENVQKQPAAKGAITQGKQRSYSEVVEFLDKNWTTGDKDTNLSRMKQLDKALGSIAQKINAIFFTGSNGKTLSTHFTSRILREEGLSVGTLQEPHVLTYNERVSINGETIPNKVFTEIANKVINTAQDIGLAANSREVITMISFLHFAHTKADVVLMEIGSGHATHPVNICNPKIIAITRVTDDKSLQDKRADKQLIEDTLSVIKKGSYVISADQGKLNLQVMQEITENLGGEWIMPIRKLAPLSYPFEQLHGRCAALAERIAHVYVNTFTAKEAIVIENSLLTKKKGQRGRPTLEAKRQSELNPKKTVEQFWKENPSTLPGRFQLLDKEKPSILLDNASNLDAMQNLLLGIRLLHYQRPLKGMALILGNNNPDLNTAEFLKLLRYFFKKTSGSVFIYPAQPAPSNTGTSWDTEAITNDIKNMKVKAVSCKSLADAYEAARQTVDERHGLIVIAGSSEAITEYWQLKGMKKLHQSD